MMTKTWSAIAAIQKKCFRLWSTTKNQDRWDKGINHDDRDDKSCHKTVILSNSLRCTISDWPPSEFTWIQFICKSNCLKLYLPVISSQKQQNNCHAGNSFAQIELPALSNNSPNMPFTQISKHRQT